MRKDALQGASRCDPVRNDGAGVAQGEERKPLRIAAVCETVEENTTGRGRTRTGTNLTVQGILSPQEFTAKQGVGADFSAEGAVQGAVETKADPTLQRVRDAWPNLPPAIRAGIIAMIDVAEEQKP
jgi:hypothetical protein